MSRLKYVYVRDTFNSQGVPDNLNYDPNGAADNDDLKITLSSATLTDVNNKLPERERLPDVHPDWMKESDLHIVENGTTIDITFVDEGAGYRNGIGYYVYNTATPPRSEEDLANLFLIFPNCSKSGGGGGLTAGDTVRLSSDHTYSVVGGKHIATPTNYQFQAGQSIGLVLFVNAYRTYKNNLNLHRYRRGSRLYSNPNLNPESSPVKRQHTVNILSDELADYIIVGFEDLNRDGNADEDFNDAILLCKASPPSGLDGGNVNTTGKLRSAGTILCDDVIGNFDHVNNDYSDLIVEYDCVQNLTNDLVTSLIFTMHLKHRSSMYDHEFGVLIPNLSSTTHDITIETFTGDSVTSVSSEPVSLNDEITLVSSTKTLLPASGNHSHYANTHPNWDQNGDQTPVSSVRCRVVFSSDVSPDLFEDKMPYRPYLRVYPSMTVGVGDSYTVRYNSLYKSNNRLPGLESKDDGIHKVLILENIKDYRCTHERYTMIEAYPEFRSYLQSNGKTHTDWHREDTGRTQYLNPLISVPSRSWTLTEL